MCSAYWNKKRCEIKVGQAILLDFAEIYWSGGEFWTIVAYPRLKDNMLSAMDYAELVDYWGLIDSRVCQSVSFPPFCPRLFQHVYPNVWLPKNSGHPKLILFVQNKTPRSIKRWIFSCSTLNLQNVPKYSYFCLIWQLLKNTNILARFGGFLGTKQFDQADSFWWATSVLRHISKVPTTR